MRPTKGYSANKSGEISWKICLYFRYIYAKLPFQYGVSRLYLVKILSLHVIEVRLAHAQPSIQRIAVQCSIIACAMSLRYTLTKPKHKSMAPGAQRQDWSLYSLLKQVTVFRAKDCSFCVKQIKSPAHRNQFEKPC